MKNSTKAILGVLAVFNVATCAESVRAANKIESPAFPQSLMVQNETTVGNLVNDVEIVAGLPGIAIGNAVSLGMRIFKEGITPYSFG